MPSEIRQHVIVVGAGPVGLVTANLLADAGLPVTLVEASDDLPRDLRASTFHPPTLDMLERFGVVRAMIEQGLICPTWQFRDRSEGVIATFELARLVTRHRPSLSPAMRAVAARRDAVRAPQGEPARDRPPRHPGGRCAARPPMASRSTCGWRTATSETLERHVPGRGRRHRQRRAQGDSARQFDGITIPELFLTLSTTYDFRATMPDLANISYLSDPREWYVLIRTARVWRALFPVDAALDDADVTSPERSERLLQGAVPRGEPYEVTHRTAYRVHERVASTYVNGRMAIAGDAAHVNNPLGGMGLNGGIHDAFNLAGRLIEVARGAPPETLARYSRQRRKVALDVVQQTALRNRAILNTREPAARRA